MSENITKGLGIAFVVLLVAIALGYFYYSQNENAPTAPVLCPADAKLCPDGSFVSRTGPDCTFAPCPGEGDIPNKDNNCGPCPQHMPPDPDFCADGEIIGGRQDECGCPLPPECKNGNTSISPVACTEEAKLCPDGSFVSRTGPDCQFAPCPGQGGEQPVNKDVQKYFNEQLVKGTLERVGQPYEGYTPSMFMQAFPKIIPQDFDGADALSGEYKIVDEKLVFVEDKGVPMLSSSDTLSKEGVEILFVKIQARTNIPIATTDDVDELLLFLSATP